MHRRSVTLLAAIGFIAGCGGDASAPPVAAAADLESPAGPNSGEPFLTSAGGAVYLSWLEAAPAGGHDLRFSRWDGEAWGEPGVIAHRDDFFVNWADFPSITAGADGTLWAHWLERGPNGGYDYGVRVVRSDDAGRHWSDSWTPHEDTSPTEHGFVATFPVDDGMGFVWLDGREHAQRPDGSEPTRDMTLRYRTLAVDGSPGAEMLVDGRVCDCCQTDAAVATSGPVVVYRDRTEEEIRDIYITRFEDGAWTEGRPVHADGWKIPACPVNGPAVATRDDDVAVAWFSAPDDVPAVHVAFSADGGRGFGPAIRVDDGQPAGRVDVMMLGDGAALVSWLERTGGDRADVRLRRIGSDGAVSDASTLTGSSAERASGFPRMISAPDGGVLVAWTDVADDEPRVRVRRLELGDR
jgi:hypothetical protein